MSKVKFKEIVSPQDKLTDSIEMIKGGMTSNLSLCITGCKIGDLKSKNKSKYKNKNKTTIGTGTPTTPSDTTIVRNP
jgi:hypothetical protein